MNEINFTVIIPHKNIPHLLQRCLDSIPRREDIQIIVVDDNSDPDKVDFANFPGLNDPYVEVVFGKNENGRKGAGYARNLGLERAKGKWLIFADADDFFTENAFEYLYEQIDSHHEIIYFKVTGCYSDTLEKVDTVYYFNQLVDNYIRQGKDCENLLRYKHGVPWGKMIKRGLVIKENICFDEILASNDTMFSLYSGYYSKSINSCAAVIYCYTISYGSLTNTVTLDTLRARYIVYLRYNAFLQQHNKRKYQAFVGHRLIYSLKYGLPVFFQFMKLAVFYKNTFFTGINTWIYICIKTKQQRKQKKKYIVFD